MTDQALYRDSLLDISHEAITFAHYGFPFGRPKRVPLTEIETVAVLPPTLANGKWRIHGSGDLRTWFPRDWKRPRRDAIFLAKLRGKRGRIGFTAEDSHRVKAVLADLGLLAR